MSVRSLIMVVPLLGFVACADQGPPPDEPGVLPRPFVLGLADVLFQIPQITAEFLTRCPVEVFIDGEEGYSVMLCPFNYPGTIGSDRCLEGGGIHGYVRGAYFGTMDWEIWFEHCVVYYGVLDHEREDVTEADFDFALVVSRPSEIEPIQDNEAFDNIRPKGLLGLWTNMGRLHECLYNQSGGDQ